ncbi:hypothetical protein FsymDg_3076 [Candidatus Protofrankia datiscae]|uniref:Uncharacterized protein n=1 Tax=Candidatus Protofrankia datiscae TaxID=2716812 RepID=F8AXN2_9ACTN|nr:hypothetical protein FsymDg_3076 [Candidatus Protofrankia datiscae]
MSIVSRPEIPSSEPDVASFPSRDLAALRFRERLRGYFSTRVTDDFQAGFARGHSARTSVRIDLTVDFDDADALLRDQSTPGRPSGSVRVPILSSTALTIEDGECVLSEPDPDRVETWHARYRLLLVADDGGRYILEGFKVLHDHPGLDAWSDTTTLNLTLRTDDGRTLGAGRARSAWRGPLRALRLARRVRAPWAIEVRGVTDAGRRREYELAALKLLARHLRRIYGGPLDEARRFPAATAHRPAGPRRRALRLPEPEVRWCGEGGRWHEGAEVGADGWLRLIRYRGGEKGPVLLAAGFAMSTGAFVTDAIRTNLTEFLVEHGYDVWLFDYRASIDLPSSTTQFTIDAIATEDWPTAVAEVRRVTGAADVQAYGHCVGSGSLLMALAAGKLPDVRSVVCAQFPLHLVTSRLNRLKIALRVSELLTAAGLRLVRPARRFTLPNAAVDLALRALPMAPSERCGQALCRWINAIFGCTHRHAQLNQATHEALHGMFGVGNIASLRHLASMMRAGRAVDAAGGDVYTRDPRFLRLPIHLLQGTENYIFLPEGSARTLRWLRDANGPELYSRSILPGYAHLDAVIGQNADRDVYPLILQHLEASAEVLTAPAEVELSR